MPNKTKKIVPQENIDAIDESDSEQIRREVGDLPLNDRPQILNPALGFAVVRQHREAAKCLLIEGANPSQSDYRGDYPPDMQVQAT